MSMSDREKWEARYRAGAYSSRTHPSALVAEHLPDIATTQRAASGADATLLALDIACGAGRNALYLAGLGYRVDAIDISSEALARGEEAARSAGVTVSWMPWDLDHGLPRGFGSYDVILVIRYLDLSLVTAAVERLRPGGYLIAEAHLKTGAAVVGPRDPNLRAAPGELRDAARHLKVQEYWEGMTSDPDGRAATLARLVAWRPYPAP